jgi:lipopolysaccharide/colanic/teichoic acid biosynthesis glycosyltransferase
MRLGRNLYDVLKRTSDLFIAAVALLLTSPIQLGIAIFLLVKQGRPILFRQARPGLRGQTFDLLKFRTMRPYNEKNGWLTDEQRLTAVGQFLRSFSLDELPSLINVLKGDMSIVGPRPLLVKYLELYTPEQARRHEVRPGITGLAQVRGRNSISWEKKFALDVEYVERKSLLLDIQILLETVAVVLHRRGVSASGEATMSEFRGTRVSAKARPDRASHDASPQSGSTMANEA